jgi:hypothetical protein
MEAVDVVNVLGSGPLHSAARQTRHDMANVYPRRAGRRLRPRLKGEMVGEEGSDARTGVPHEPIHDTYSRRAPTLTARIAFLFGTAEGG